MVVQARPGHHSGEHFYNGTHFHNETEAETETHAPKPTRKPSKPINLNHKGGEHRGRGPSNH